jgi:hypothetical protein
MSQATIPAPNAKPRAINVLIVSLRDLICDIFGASEPEFEEFLMVSFDDFDYSGRVQGEAFKQRALMVIRLFNGDRGPGGIVELARRLSVARPLRRDLADFVQELTAAFAPPPALGNAGQPAGGNPGGGPAPPLQLPAEFVATIALFDQRSFEECVKDLRATVRAIDYAAFEVPRRFHLSALKAERCAAILCLEAMPDPAFLRWLSERVTVESPEIAYAAVQALIAAALRLPKERLKEVQDQVRGAIDRLDSLVDDEDSSPLFDIAVRKREFRVADDLISMRTRARPGTLKPDDLDLFYSQFFAVFTLKEVEQILNDKIEFPLWTLAKKSDPIEVVAACIAVKARERGWEFDLVRFANAAKPGPVFQGIADRFRP